MSVLRAEYKFLFLNPRVLRSLCPGMGVCVIVYGAVFDRNSAQVCNFLAPKGSTRSWKIIKEEANSFLKNVSRQFKFI